MRKGIRKILVTGGAGFIGSAFVRNAAAKEYRVVVCDKLTYAASLKRLEAVKGKITFYKADICDAKKIERIIKKEKIETVLHFAAETHVDRSIRDSRDFLKTNILGTHVLLDASRKCRIKKFIHISTDEVYGDIKKGKFDEGSPLKPNSPYAASKAAADLLIKSYIRTYDFPAVIVRPCNNYGPWQYPEKLIPLSILKLMRNEKVPVYAKGKNVREWLFVEDCAQGILKILEKGRIGSIYNLGSSVEKENITVVKMLISSFNKDPKMFEFVRDRPGHDIRYSLDSRKVRTETGWKPAIDFNAGLKITVDWYRRNSAWLLALD